MIHITCNGRVREVPDGCTVREAVSTCSPFGTEPVIVTRNGVRLPTDSSEQLADGDLLLFYPVLIGG